MASIDLSALTGTYYNIGSASADTSHVVSGEVVGGFAVLMSRSVTTEPTVSATGTATKVAGANWVVDTDMYLNVYSYDGTNVFYFWSDNISGIIDRVHEDLAVTGTKSLDWEHYESFYLVMTGVTTLSSVNLASVPVGKSKVISIILEPNNFATSIPAEWVSKFLIGAIDSTTTNLIVLEYVNAPTAPYFITQISQTK